MPTQMTIKKDGPKYFVSCLHVTGSSKSLPYAAILATKFTDYTVLIGGAVPYMPVITAIFRHEIKHTKFFKFAQGDK